MVPPYVGLSRNQVGGIQVREMLFEVFQDGCQDGHLEYQNGMILANLNFHVAQMPPTKSSVQFNVWFGRRYLKNSNKMAILEIWTEWFHGWKFKISKILNFRNLNFKTCRMPIKMNNFKFKWLIVNLCQRSYYNLPNSAVWGWLSMESFFMADASLKISAQADLWFRRRCYNQATTKLAFHSNETSKD